MKNILATATLGLLVGGAALTANAQQAVTTQPNAHVAGTAPLGVTVTSMNAVVLGWSAKKAILGKVVLNDQRQKIGAIDDIIARDGVALLVGGSGLYVSSGFHDFRFPGTDAAVRARL